MQDPKPVTAKEAQRIAQAQSKWWPVIFQSFNTNVLDLMASPSKKAFLSALFACVIVFVYVWYTKMNQKRMKGMAMWIILGVVFVFASTYYTQWKKNENIIAVSTRLPNRFESSVFDYQNNMAVQGELYRNSGGSSIADAFILGSVFQSMKGNRRR